MNKKYGRYLGWAIIVFFLFLVGWYTPKVIHSVDLSSHIVKLNPTSTVSANQSQYELNLVYIGCASCAASNIQGLPEAINKIEKALMVKALRNDYDLHTIGIAKDYIPETALKYLSKYGFFDEMMIGNDWSNLGILKYTYEISGSSSVPQIVITIRKFRQVEGMSETTYRGVEQEALILRKIGGDKIIAWAESGANLPTDTFQF